MEHSSRRTADLSKGNGINLSAFAKALADRSKCIFVTELNSFEIWKGPIQGKYSQQSLYLDNCSDFKNQEQFKEKQQTLLIRKRINKNLLP
jgi:hypothetical protein